MQSVALKMVPQDPQTSAAGRILHWSEREKRDRLVADIDLLVLGLQSTLLPGRRLSIRAKGDMIDVIFGVRSARAWALLSDDVCPEVAPATTFLVHSPVDDPSVVVGGLEPAPRALRKAGWRTALKVLTPGPSDRPAPGNWVFADAEVYVLSRAQGNGTEFRVEFLR